MFNCFLVFDQFDLAIHDCLLNCYSDNESSFLCRIEEAVLFRQHDYVM